MQVFLDLHPIPLYLTAQKILPPAYIRENHIGKHTKRDNKYEVHFREAGYSFQSPKIRIAADLLLSLFLLTCVHPSHLMHASIIFIKYLLFVPILHEAKNHFGVATRQEGIGTTKTWDQTFCPRPMAHLLIILGLILP